MVLIAVEAVPAGSKPPAAVSVRIFTGERHSFDAAAPLSTRESSLQQQDRVRGLVGGVITEAGETYRVEIDLGRRAISTHHSIYRSVLRTLVSPGVWSYLCLYGETWLPSFLLQTCKTLCCRSHFLSKFVQFPVLFIEKLFDHFI